ncbi:MAG: anthranilate phosphoribosyltransferase [Dictyoglomus sp.]|nr:anthranilate phosphoribosyltransferase [Dictyoglomus sp.]MCX7942082.1 anthranilate phosphoribosyltransferase [Dictyoglomaceae bacterium]MDW8187929.1 anthranilate phosphoribosyltransferase [Dictyoglomus sp.]
MIKEIIKKLSMGNNLSFEESQQIVESIEREEITEAQLGGILLSLRVKGETPEEIAGFISSLHKKAKKVMNKSPAIDVCGTGGDQAKTFNISTGVAFVLASLGIPVAKHGNRAVSSRSGSIDVIEALGVKFSEDPEKVAEEIDKVGLSFIFAPYFHPVVGKAGKVRRELGIGTIFNLAGPMLNPANLQAQILGVYSLNILKKLAESAKILGRKNILFYHGREDGIDEISLSGPTEMAWVKEKDIDYFVFHPKDIGLRTYPLEEFVGGTPQENAEILINIFKGKGTPAQTDILSLNSAFGLLVLGKVKNVKEGFERIKEHILEGKVYQFLERLRGMKEWVY